MSLVQLHLVELVGVKVMILSHVRTHAKVTKPFHSKIDLKKEVLNILLENKEIVLNLKHNYFRSTYGEEDLAIIVGLLNETEISLYVYKVSEMYKIKDYRINYDYPRNLLLAYLPVGTTSWLDTGIKIVTRENTNSLDKDYNYIQIFHNELGSNPTQEELKPVFNFCLNGENPWAKGYLFPEEIIVDVKEIR